MIEISKISSSYDIRRLGDTDSDSILGFCRRNTQYYEYCEAEPTKEQVLNDLHITPPGIALSDKYYIGFYQNETLIAVMDLIDGYPEPEVAYIGFFMMNKDVQGKGIGTEIIREMSAYLKTEGKTAVRLAIDKGNPQSTHFWKKNGFIVIKEVDRNGWTALVAEKQL
ncbi:MAG: GNAT family N-acetyltransferase [Oscillospiraceae bacterium]|nr:GNAT family N-acetyltransferase [Oscillospiraceae bacterium]